eukprot:s463_g22.t1
MDRNDPAKLHLFRLLLDSELWVAADVSRSQLGTMGILGKLSFWKKSSATTVTAVQPFTSPEAAEIRVASQAAAIEELEDVQAPKAEPEEPSALAPSKGGAELFDASKL